MGAVDRRRYAGVRSAGLHHRTQRERRVPWAQLQGSYPNVAYPDSGAGWSSTWYYRIAAIDNAGNVSAFSGVVGPVTTDPQPRYSLSVSNTNGFGIYVWIQNVGTGQWYSTSGVAQGTKPAGVNIKKNKSQNLEQPVVRRLQRLREYVDGRHPSAHLEERQRRPDGRQQHDLLLSHAAIEAHIGDGGAQQSGMTLVEVLIGMVIMSVITVMILVTWFALSRSYSYSATSNKTRDHAREALARMEREIRDAQINPNTSETALVRARPLTVVVSTTFNMAGNSDPGMVLRGW